MADSALLAVRGLGRTYTCRNWLGAERAVKVALRDASFTLGRGAALTVIGASGSGKSTLARCLAGWDRPTAGEILLDGRTPARGEIQLIPQQPAESLNPRFTAGEIVAEPLVIRREGTARSRAARAVELLEAVGLARDAVGKRALEFSGGERQRLALARALATNPKVLVLDEALAGLDLSLQARIGRLLLDLRRDLGVACVLISHDLSAAARLAGEIAVMEGGTIVEHAPAGELMANPRHPRTRELVAAGALA